MGCNCGQPQAVDPSMNVVDTEVVATINGKQVTKSDVRTFGAAIGLFTAFVVWASGDD